MNQAGEMLWFKQNWVQKRIQRRYFQLKAGVSAATSSGLQCEQCLRFLHCDTPFLDRLELGPDCSVVAGPAYLALLILADAPVRQTACAGEETEGVVRVLQVRVQERILSSSAAGVLLFTRVVLFSRVLIPIRLCAR